MGNSRWDWKPEPGPVESAGDREALRQGHGQPHGQPPVEKLPVGECAAPAPGEQTSEAQKASDPPPREVGPDGRPQVGLEELRLLELWALEVRRMTEHQSAAMHAQADRMRLQDPRWGMAAALLKHEVAATVAALAILTPAREALEAWVNERRATMGLPPVPPFDLPAAGAGAAGGGIRYYPGPPDPPNGYRAFTAEEMERLERLKRNAGQEPEKGGAG